MIADIKSNAQKSQQITQTQQSLISWNIFEESYSNLKENIGCLEKFLPKNLGRYQKLFEKILKNVEENNEDSRDFFKRIFDKV